MGSSVVRFLANFDAGNAISYFDQLYSVQENRTIWWSEAFDLLFRTQINPKTKDIPGLTALYQKHEKPLFSGYLRKFVPPNKVVISELHDAYQPPEVRLMTDEAKNQAKQLAERAFYPQLKVVIEYPWKYEDYQEELFNSKNEFSGIILLYKEQPVCPPKRGICVDNNPRPISAS